jgi:uncharacterized protein
MKLTERLEKDYVTAYKAKDADRLSVLRLLKTAVKNSQVELRRPLNDDEVLDVLARQAKQRRESVDMFSNAGRTDLIEKEERELSILLEYLPAPLSDEELAGAVDAAITTLAAAGMKDMGRVVKAVLTEHKGRVDGKRVSELVKSRLSG